MEKVVPFFTRSFWISQIMYGFEFYSKLFEFCLYGFKPGYCAAGDPPVSAPLPCFNGRTMPTPCVGRFRLLSRCQNPLFVPCHVDAAPDPPPKSFLAIAQFHTPMPNSSPQSLAKALVSPLCLLFDQGCWRAVDVPRFKVPAASSPILVSRPSMRCGSISVCVSTTSRSRSDAGTVTHRR
jgi:hypothetical protein